MQILRSPQAWKPCQAYHPWTGSCPACTWAKKIMESGIQDGNDPGDFVSQLAAVFFMERIQAWLHSASRRIKPVVCWRCPWCRTGNRRLIDRNRLKGAAQASSLMPPCDPEVLLETTSGPVSVTFGFPWQPGRPGLVRPLRDARRPAIRATPDPRHPHRLALNGTNRPCGFICQRCGRDCLGVLASPLNPAPWWEP